MSQTTKERIFAKHGCTGFWRPEYATLPTSTLVNLLKSKNDRRLAGVIGSLSRLTTGAGPVPPLSRALKQLDDAAANLDRAGEREASKLVGRLRLALEFTGYDVAPLAAEFDAAAAARKGAR